MIGIDSLIWLAAGAAHELLLFAGFFFLLGAIDELAVDVTWGWLRLTGRARSCTWSRTCRGRAG